MNDSVRGTRFQFSTKALLLLMVLYSVYALLFLTHDLFAGSFDPSFGAFLHVWMAILMLHVAISFYAHPRPGMRTMVALLLAAYVCYFPAAAAAQMADMRLAQWTFLFLLAHAALFIRSIGLSSMGFHKAAAYLFVVVMGSLLVIAVLADS